MWNFKQSVKAYGCPWVNLRNIPPFLKHPCPWEYHSGKEGMMRLLLHWRSHMAVWPLIHKSYAVSSQCCFLGTYKYMYVYPCAGLRMAPQTLGCHSSSENLHWRNWKRSTLGIFLYQCLDESHWCFLSPILARVCMYLCVRTCACTCIYMCWHLDWVWGMQNRRCLCSSVDTLFLHVYIIGHYSFKFLLPLLERLTVKTLL